MDFNNEPLYIDDIISITEYTGKISCVRFDKDIITVRFFDRNDKTIVLHRREKELINCDISAFGNGKSMVYLSVKIDDIFRGYKTSNKSAEVIKSYYESYNDYLSNLAIEEEKRSKLEEERKRIVLEQERIVLEQKQRMIELEQEQRRKKLFQKLNINNIDKMTGYEFEDFVGYLFEKIGYKVIVTQRSNDQGIDIIIKDDFTKIGVQAKCYSSPVGNKAIQEAVAGRKYYNCDKVMVVTNNIFTQAAIELANCNNVGLIARKELCDLINKYWDRN